MRRKVLERSRLGLSDFPSAGPEMLASMLVLKTSNPATHHLFIVNIVALLVLRGRSKEESGRGGGGREKGGEDGRKGESG